MECIENKNVKKSTPVLYIIKNLPLIIIIISGTLITGSVWWGFGIFYGVYSIAALIIFMKCICPYCACMANASCTSGYHLIVSRFFRPKEGKTYYYQFKHYILFLYPVWFIPPPAGIYFLFREVSWLMISYLVIFSITGFLILPIASKSMCRECGNACNCPRMRKERKKKAGKLNTGIIRRLFSYYPGYFL